MTLFTRFKSSAAAAPVPAPAAPVSEDGEQPVRRRTFSATQFREEELARAAEIHALQEAAESAAVAAAEETRRRRMMEAEENRLDAEEDDDGPGAAVQPPMDWEETIGWLSTKSAEARNLIAQNWNWENDLRVLQFLVAQPDIDMGVATGIFWLTGATDDFFPWGDEADPSDLQFKRAADMVNALGRRFSDEDFTEARFGFDDSWDCGQLKERLEELYMDGRIEWSPANIPVTSPGPQPTIEDVAPDERREVKDFLARHGAY